MKMPATGGTAVTSRQSAGTRATLNQTVSAPKRTMNTNGTARLTPLIIDTPTRTTSEASRAMSTHSGKIQALRPQPVTGAEATSRSAMNDRENDATATPITSSSAAPSTVRRFVGSSDQLIGCSFRAWADRGAEGSRTAAHRRRGLVVVVGDVWSALAFAVRHSASTRSQRPPAASRTTAGRARLRRRPWWGGGGRGAAEARRQRPGPAGRPAAPPRRTRRRRGPASEPADHQQHRGNEDQQPQPQTGPGERYGSWQGTGAQHQRPPSIVVARVVNTSTARYVPAEEITISSATSSSTANRLERRAVLRRRLVVWGIRSPSLQPAASGAGKLVRGNAPGGADERGIHGVMGGDVAAGLAQPGAPTTRLAIGAAVAAIAGDRAGTGAVARDHDGADALALGTGHAMVLPPGGVGCGGVSGEPGRVGAPGR